MSASEAKPKSAVQKKYEELVVFLVQTFPNVDSKEIMAVAKASKLNKEESLKVLNAKYKIDSNGKEEQPEKKEGKMEVKKEAVPAEKIFKQKLEAVMKFTEGDEELAKEALLGAAENEELAILSIVNDTKLKKKKNRVEKPKEEIKPGKEEVEEEVEENYFDTPEEAEKKVLEMKREKEELNEKLAFEPDSEEIFIKSEDAYWKMWLEQYRATQNHEVRWDPIAPKIVEGEPLASPQEYAAELREFLDRMGDEEKERSKGGKNEEKEPKEAIVISVGKSLSILLHEQLRKLQLLAFPNGNKVEDRVEEEKVVENLAHSGFNEDLDKHSLEECEVLQEEEKTVLHSMYEQDFTVSSSQPVRYSLNIVSSGAQCLFATFILPLKYPFAPVEVKINYDSLVTISPSRLQELNRLIQNDVYKNLGAPQILSVVDIIEKFVENHPQKEKNAIYQPRDALRILLGGSYHATQQSEVMALQNEIAQQVSAILGLSVSSCKVALAHFEWDKEKTVQSYLEAQKDKNKMEEWFKSCNLNPPSNKLPKVSSDTQTFECLTCFDDVKMDEGCRMDCGHFCCNVCWEAYLRIQISEGAGSIKCPGHKCQNPVDRNVLTSYVDQDLYRKYVKFSLGGFVDKIPNACWCNTKGCELVMMTSNRANMVKCECDSMWCFSCGAGFHFPATCKQEKWMEDKRKKHHSSDDSFSEKFIMAFTKECIRCRSPIEKDGGCNHMTCHKCRTEFCWVCMGPWTGGSHYICSPKSDSELVSNYKTAAMNFSFPQIRLVHKSFQSKDDAKVKQMAERVMNAAGYAGSCTPIMFQNCEIIVMAYDLIFLARTIIFNMCNAGEYMTTFELTKKKQKLKSIIDSIQGNIALIHSVTDCPIKQLDFRLIENASKTLVRCIAEARAQVKDIQASCKEVKSEIK